MFGREKKKVEIKQPRERKSMMTVKKHEEVVEKLKHDHEFAIRKGNQDHDLKVLELKQMHELELNEKVFELKHFKDNELLKMKTERDEAVKKQAILEKENKMLNDMVDLNADIIDIKDLVKKLIEKLPSINLQSLTMQQLGGGK